MPALALVVLVLVAVSAHAERSAPGSTPHLFSVPSEGPAAVALARTQARVLARYAAFTLVEAEGEDATRLRRAGADQRDDMREVRLGRSVLDPATERAPLAAKQRVPDDPGLAVVQFVGPIKDAWLERLRKTGVRVVTYMAENGYLVRGSGEQLAAIAGLVGSDLAVRAVVPFGAADKLGAGVRTEGRQRLAVQTLSGSDGAPGRSRVDDLGREVHGMSAVGPFRTQYVELDAADAAALARDPGVISIQPAPEPRLRDEVANQIVAGAVTGPNPLVPTGPGYLAFYGTLGLGSGTFPFVVDVTDEGIDVGSTSTGQADLHEEGALANPSRIAYADDFTSDPDARDCGGHGTINASIIGGFNNGTGATVEDAAGFNYGLGVAPRVQLGASKIFLCASGNFGLTGTVTDLTSSSYGKGARIANHSWGANSGGAYTASSQEFDALVRDAQPGTPGNQQMVEVVSAGNAGSAPNTVGSPATAKNVIAVGAAENVRAGPAPNPPGTDGCGITDVGADDAHDIINFSSRGPTDDARIKPDVVGPGTHVTGTQSDAVGYNGSGVCTPAFPAGSTLYSMSSGTSHSTPVVTGLAALFREWFRQNRGGGTAVPSPALTKAVLANAATDLNGGDGVGGNLPNNNQGWGLGNLARALDTDPRVLSDQQTTFVATGDESVRTFQVQDPSAPVRITLAWTDPPGPTVGNSFVNNLDLTVGAGAGTFKGNVFAGGVSAPGGTADPRNNLESVYLPGGTSGTFSVAVTAANIAGDGVPGNADATDQDFALVVSNAAEVVGPVITPEATTVAPEGDGDAALEPSEGFTLSQQLRNGGTADATGISGTLDGPSSVILTDVTAAWPDLSPAESAANSDPLGGTLNANATCGAPISLTLAITTTEGVTADIPVAVQTGAAGTASARNSTDVPKSIPDNNAVGVTSSLGVADEGVIKDVNVRIGSLAHPFVGDLKLELNSPGGTTVVLANRPGGTGNNGNNFTNTIFDDQASASIGSPGTAAPYTGSFRPQADELSRFANESQQGTWTLKATDLAAQDTGTLQAWGHDIAIAECDFQPTDPPGQPTGLGATGDVESVALDWDDTPTATGYEVFRKGGDGNYPAVPTATPSSSEFTDSARTAGQDYCYKVRAVNDAGAGPLSDEACATAEGSPPGAIAGLGATPAVESVALDWADTPTATGYEVFRKGGDGNYPAVPTATPSSSEFTDSGRTAGREYCYKVRAVNTWGEGPLSGEACATAEGSPPGAIAGLGATPAVESVALDWADTPEAEGYYVFRRNQVGDYPVLPTATVGASQHTDSGLPGGVQQCYRVQAHNQWGVGPLSEERCASVPLPGAPPGPGGPAGPGGPPGPGGPAGTLPVEIRIDLSGLPRSIRVSGPGIFVLSFLATPGQAGSLKITTVKAVAAARKRKLVVARKPFTVPASGRARVKVRLNRRGLRVLKRVRRLPVSVKVTVATRTASRRVTLRAPRPRR